MYKVIRSHPTTLELYARKLVAEGVLSENDLEESRAKWRQHLEGEYEAGMAYRANKADWLDGRWSGLRSATEVQDDDRRGTTAVPLETLKDLGEKLTTLPAQFNVHRTISRILENRRKAIETGEGLDWSTAESLAFASLLDDGHPVRLSGQDSERGTFSQRHSVLIDQETEGRYIPLNNLRDGQGRYEVINSMLSEEAVLGLRIRLFPQRAQRADAVGGAVRRLRQRRPGGLRPVHLLR